MPVALRGRGLVTIAMNGEFDPRHSEQISKLSDIERDGSVANAVEADLVRCIVTGMEAAGELEDFRPDTSGRPLRSE